MKAWLARVHEVALTHQFHMLGLVLAVLSLLAHAVLPEWQVLQQGLQFDASFAFALGFSIWCWPTLRKAWRNPIARVAILVLHVVVLMLATVLSRNVVAAALGLPPQDFDMTVNFLTLAMYVPVWSVVVCLLVGVFAFFLYGYGLLVGLFEEGFSKCFKLFGQAAGAFAICFFSAKTFQLAADNQELLYSAIRWTAYFADFQGAVAYPGVGAAERVRLHENGIVSTATVNGFEVSIRVRKHE